ncbi:hypothetical protein FBU31_008049, partial [Coemansia sp. 'formosensis']
VSTAHLRRLRTLQDGFREKHVPKLEDDMLFFNPDVYKRYTVMARPEERVAEVVVAAVGPTPVEPPAPLIASETLAPPLAQQKRSSLRIGADVVASSVEQSSAAVNGAAVAATRVSEADNGVARQAAGDSEPMTVDLPVSARTRHATSSLEEDDVVGAILGVMGSPKSRTNNSQMQTSSAPAPAFSKPTTMPQDIPNDMLVAMMAIEGVNNAEVAGKLTTARNKVESAPNKETATRLPKGYGGPFSQLTTVEHRQFLELAQRMKTGVALNSRENTEYQRLKPKVESEQQAFRLQAREKTIPVLKSISEPVAEAALGELAGIGVEALKSYPPVY